MFEGFRRLKALGAVDVSVGTGEMEAANRFYESVGFPELYKSYVWRKVAYISMDEPVAWATGSCTQLRVGCS